jgi:DNA-binding XRE family transcriptional regulator
LIELLVAQRKRAGLTQAALADRIGRVQPVIAAIEVGSRRVDVVELIEIAAAIGLDLHTTIDELIATPLTGEE